MCSGIGGMRVAFQQACGESTFPTKWRAMEVDQTCCKVYAELFGSEFVQGVRAEERWLQCPGDDEVWRCSIDKLPDAAFEGADVWLLTPPCQPFTRTGKKLDTRDPRCAALLRVLEALPSLAQPPRAILLENVPGFARSEARRRLLRALAEAQGVEYAVREYDLDPVEFGFPNTRRRYYCAALARDADADAGDALAALAPPSVPVRRVGDFCEAAGDDSDASAAKELRVPRRLLMQAAKDGWQLDVATAASQKTKTFCGSYTKSEYGGEGLSKAGPIMLTEADGWTPAQGEQRRRFAMPERELWSRLRYFSPREALALQGYPEGWTLPTWVGAKKQLRLIGNSINTAVVAHLLRPMVARVSERALLDERVA